MKEFLFPIFLFISLLYIWFDTDAFIQWAKLFRIKFLYSKYDEYLKTSFQFSDYQTFLAVKYNNFFIHLVCCPICLAVWFCLIFSIIRDDYIDIVFNIIFTWVGYYLLKYLIKKLN